LLTLLDHEERLSLPAPLLAPPVLLELLALLGLQAFLAPSELALLEPEPAQPEHKTSTTGPPAKSS
jgi:hypothetical protein